MEIFSAKKNAIENFDRLDSSALNGNSSTRSNQSKSKMRVKLPITNVCIQQTWLIYSQISLIYRFDIATYLHISKIYVSTFDMVHCCRLVFTLSVFFSILLNVLICLHNEWVELIGIFLSFVRSFFQIICLSANQNPYVVWLHTFLFVCAWANGFKHL